MKDIKLPPFSPRTALRVVANDWATLRGCDLYRLLNAYGPYNRGVLLDCIKRERPDLHGRAMANNEDITLEDLSGDY